MYLGSLPAVSNREDWRLSMQLIDDEDAVVDIQACSISMTLRDFQTKQQMFKGSTTTGEITIGTDNTFQWLFPAQTMSGLCQRQYEVGLRVGQAGLFSQIFIATLDVLEGIDQ